MTVEKTYQGAWRIYAIVGDYLESRQYFDYTKKEAIAMFKNEFDIK